MRKDHGYGTQTTNDLTVRGGGTAPPARTKNYCLTKRRDSATASKRQGGTKAACESPSRFDGADVEVAKLGEPLLLLCKLPCLQHSETCPCPVQLLFEANDLLNSGGDFPSAGVMSSSFFCSEGGPCVATFTVPLNDSK